MIPPPQPKSFHENISIFENGKNREAANRIAAKRRNDAPVDLYRRGGVHNYKKHTTPGGPLPPAASEAETVWVKLKRQREAKKLQEQTAHAIRLQAAARRFLQQCRYQAVLEERAAQIRLQQRKEKAAIQIQAVFRRFLCLPHRMMLLQRKLAMQEQRHREALREIEDRLQEEVEIARQEARMEADLELLADAVPGQEAKKIMAYLRDKNKKLRDENKILKKEIRYEHYRTCKLRGTGAHTQNMIRSLQHYVAQNAETYHNKVKPTHEKYAKRHRDAVETLEHTREVCLLERRLRKLYMKTTNEILERTEESSERRRGHHDFISKLYQIAAEGEANLRR